VARRRAASTFDYEGFADVIDGNERRTAHEHRGANMENERETPDVEADDEDLAEADLVEDDTDGVADENNENP
jgi:hypothetical protein